MELTTMIITKTPYRVSFFGGGTDYPEWYSLHGGKVISTSINKYCYLTARFLPQFFDCKHRISWSLIEEVNEFQDIKHPAVREVLKAFNFSEGISIHHEGDLPARAGLGSSSSFMVGILHACYLLKGEYPSKQHLAEQAIHFEQTVLNDCVGIQDQIAVARGGLNYINIQKDGSFEVYPLNIPQKRIQTLQDNMMLYFTGTTRYASEIAKKKVESFTEKEAQVKQMSSLVDQALDTLLNNRPLAEFGELLDESWKIKRSLTSCISTEMIDDIYERARSAGAIGGKLLGAGGGGFMLVFCPPEKQANVRAKLNDLLEIPFEFDFQGADTILSPNFSILKNQDFTTFAKKAHAS